MNTGFTTALRVNYNWSWSVPWESRGPRKLSVFGGVNVKDHALRWMVVLSVVLAVPVAVNGQDWKGRIDLDGTVTNPAGEGLSGSTVTAVYLETGTGPNQEFAGGDGDFDLDDLKPGMWQITVNGTHLGYIISQREIEVLPRGNEDLEFVLPAMQDLVSQAAVDTAARNYSGAREKYQMLLFSLPNNVNLHGAVAETYKAEGNLPQAMDEYDAMLAWWADVAPPAEPGLPVEIGIQAMMLAGDAGQYQRMHGYVNGLGRPLPSDWMAAFIDLSANTLMEREEYGHAIRVLDVAIRRSSRTALPYYYRGMARVQANRQLADGEEENYDPAADDFERFVELSPNDSAQKRQALDLLSKIRPQ